MRRLATLFALLLLADCKSLDVPMVVIPDGALVYRIEPTLITYLFTDTTHLTDVHLRWITDAPPPQMPLAGWNCIALSPNTPTDTTGSFVFAFVGPNIGRLEQTVQGVTDSINGYLLRGDQGTGGNFVVHSSGQLTLNWHDGTRSRFFDPAASIRLANDTIFSDADLRDRGDSVRAQWKIRWVRALDCNS
jgi:hypothetical protein